MIRESPHEGRALLTGGINPTERADSTSTPLCRNCCVISPCNFKVGGFLRLRTRPSPSRASCSRAWNTAHSGFSRQTEFSGSFINLRTFWHTFSGPPVLPRIDIPGHAGCAIFLCSEYPRADTRRGYPPSGTSRRQSSIRCRNPGQESASGLLSLPRSLPGPGSESRSPGPPGHIRVTGRGPAPGGCHWGRFPASIIMMMMISGIGPLCPSTFRWTVDFNVT
jgi:hypothetical protein